MDFEDQEFDDEGDELLACADVPDPGNGNLGYMVDQDLDQINFDEVIEEDDTANISIGAEDTQSTSKSNMSYADGSLGFDLTTGKLWIYPTNYPVRDYQYNIVQQALFKNTLVVLPTGLGKTFIAAVVMYNFYRWFPHGKVVFMAPTKPLVAQQMQACYHIMGIPKSDTVEMTGTIHPTVRQRQWKEKRIIFLTPQVMTNDLSRGSCEAKSFKCLVVDEAHKALGNQSYCQVIRELCKFTNKFRVLALSATPGSTLKAVQTVMNNLLVSHIELRTEDSIDIKPYTHERKVEKVVVPLGEELTAIKQQYIQIMTFVTQRLTRNRALYNMEATRISKFLLLKARDEFRQNPPQNIQSVQRGNVEADFCLAISLYHGYDLLQLHGLRSLYNFLMGILSGDKGYGLTKAELLRNADFNSIMDKLHHKFSSSSAASANGPESDIDNKVVVGHPKMQVLEKIVVDHFKSYKNKNMTTKVVIFSQFRDSVQEIATILNQHQPLVKVMPFIGQSSAGKEIKGFTQKEQLEVMRKFREAGCNTLVSTCVGEEGLDIGDVDLIICFDAHKSPIRLVQRMGRTGRKREGKIVMLITEGKEEQIYNQSLSSKKSIHKAILNGAKSLRFYPNNPRMVPASVNPQCHKMFITVPTENNAAGASSSNRRSSGGKKGRQSIADAFRKQGPSTGSSRTDGHLTQTEFEQIRDEFLLVSSTAKHLPKPKCLVLTKRSEMQSQSVSGSQDQSQVMNLSEWAPWQNRLQKTFYTGHSIQSQHLVRNSEFIENQHVIGEEEDYYGNEMKQFVNRNDVSQSNITSFLMTPAKVKGHGNQAAGPASSSHHRQEKDGSGAGTSYSCDTEAHVIDSGESDREEACDSQGDPRKDQGTTKPKLFTELKGSQRSRGKKGCNNSKASSKRKDCRQNSRRSTRLLGTPQSSGKSRIQLLKKSKKTLQKRKSSISHLLESKLAAVSELPDKDDFEQASQPGAETHFLDDDMEVVAVTSAVLGDSHKTSQMSAEGEGSENDSCLVLKDDALKIDSNNGNKASVEHRLKSPSLQNSSTTVNGRRSSENRQKLEKRTHVQMVPPAPPLCEVEKLVSDLGDGQGFAELDLDKLVQEWGQQAGNTGCEYLSKTYDDFRKQEENSVENRDTLVGGKRSISPNTSLVSEQDNALAPEMEEESCIFLEKNCVRKNGLALGQQIVNEQKEQRKASLEKELNSEAVSPTFKSSGHQLLYPCTKRTASKSKHSSTHYNAREKKQPQRTGDGEADNPVIISPGKNTRRGSLLNNFLSANPRGDNSTTVTPGNRCSPDRLASALPAQGNEMSPSDEISFSPLVGDGGENQNFSNMLDDTMGLDAMADSQFKDALQKNKIHNLDQTPDKRGKQSESFVTLSQAHDCLQTSSSENSNEAICNQSSSRAKSETLYSPTVNRSASVYQKGKFSGAASLTKKKKQISLDQFVRSSSRNSSPASSQMTANKDNVDGIGLQQNSEKSHPLKSDLSLSPQKLKGGHASSENSLRANDQHSSPGNSKTLGNPQSPFKLNKASAPADDDDSILAQFDLGFDFDDEVIPPTPTKESPSGSPSLRGGARRPLFSQTNNTCNTTSFSVSGSGRQKNTPALPPSSNTGAENCEIPALDQNAKRGPVLPFSDVDGKSSGSFLNKAEEYVDPRVLGGDQNTERKGDEVTELKGDQGTRANNFGVPEDFLSGFDLGAEMDDLDPSPEDQAPESPGVVCTPQISVDAEAVVSDANLAESDCVAVCRDDAPSTVKKSAAVLNGGHKKTFDASESINKTKSLFEACNTVVETHRDNIDVDPIIIDPIVIDGKDTSNSNSDVSPNDVPKSKSSKLKLGRRKEQSLKSSNCDKKANSLANKSSSALSSVQQPQLAPVLKTKPSKMRFNLRVPDFSDDDDDNDLILCDGNEPPPQFAATRLNISAKDRLSSAHSVRSKSDAAANFKQSNLNKSLSPLQDIKDASGGASKFSPPPDKCSTPVRPLPGTSRLASVIRDDIPALTPIAGSPEKDIIVTEDFDDTSPIVRKRKPKTVVDISSENEDAGLDSKSTGCAHKKQVKKKKHTDGLAQRNGFISCAKPPASAVDGDDSDDFEEPLSFVASPVALPPREGHKRKIKKPEFIEEEAEVSGEEGSSDENEAEAEDMYDASFINNDTEMTQTQGADMRAMYLKSVKSPPAGGRYKLQFNAKRQRREDIYSQAPEEDQGLSEYEEDSFCVGSDEEDSESETESPPKKAKKKKSKSEKLKQVHGKRQIRMLAASSDEDDSVRIPMTQEFQTSHSRKTALLSSDEEEEDVGRLRKKARRITDDTLSQRDDHKDKDIQSCEVNKNPRQEGSPHNTETFTLLKESRLGFDSGKARTEILDGCPKDGDFNLLDDEWLEDLDLPPDAMSKFKHGEKINEFGTKTTSAVSNDSISGLSGQDKSPSNSSFNSMKVSNNSPVTASMSRNVDSKNSNNSRTSAVLLDTGMNNTIESSNDFPKPVNALIMDTKMSGKTESGDVDFPKPLTNAATVARVSLTREERLQRQKEKQERFRLKLAEAQHRRGGLGGEDGRGSEEGTSLSPGSAASPSLTISRSAAESDKGQQSRDTGVKGQERIAELTVSTSSVPTTPSADAGRRGQPGISGKTPDERTLSGSDSVTSLSETLTSDRRNVSPGEAGQSTSPGSSHQLQVLVDSKEISGAQDVISSLRLTHSIVVTARRLSSCDYIVSNYTAVDRLPWSSFSNSSGKAKLVSRVNGMKSLYDRCVLVVEDDRVKAGQDKAKKQVNHTKYVDTTIAYLMQTKVKVYFTGNHGETASVLAELCRVEARKGRSITAPASLSDRKEAMLNFVLAIPGLTMPQALNLVHRYRNVAELISSPVTVIQERGQMTGSAAQSVHGFLRHRFDPQIMPHTKK